MSNNDSSEIRSAAESLISMSVHRPSYNPNDLRRTQNSINLITEEFLGGYMQDGRMSVVRRFFVLFVTFDLFFVSLLWLICIMITGDNIFHAFQKQIVHYTIYTSLFDVVAAAICRFVVLIFFYAILYRNHWSVIALSTSGSCLFLISKVFVYDWVQSSQQVFEVILIITSFVLAWGEAWFLDCRVIPQERHARHYFTNLTTNDRTSLMVPFLASSNSITIQTNPPESVNDFYSPLDTAHHSDQEDEEDDEYHRMGLDCLHKAYELLEAPDWKVEKVITHNDTIRSVQRDKLGKIYRLTGRLKYPAKDLHEELFYKIEGSPKWNPAILESKIVRKVNSYTDIIYQATVGGGGGMIKARDFVNLRCWRLFRNGRLCTDNEDYETDSDEENLLGSSLAGSVSTLSSELSIGSFKRVNFNASVSVHDLAFGGQPVSPETNPAFNTLSKSLGAKDFSTTTTVPGPPIITQSRIRFEEPPPLDDTFEDAKDNLDVQLNKAARPKVRDDKVWLSAAVGVDYKTVPTSRKYTRGQNIIAAFALREIPNKTDACIFEWMVCLDLKGYIPRYVLDSAYSVFMADYMTYLRKYVKELRQQRRRTMERERNSSSIAN